MRCDLLVKVGMFTVFTGKRIMHYLDMMLTKFMFNTIKEQQNSFCVRIQSHKTTIFVLHTPSPYMV